MKNSDKIIGYLEKNRGSGAMDIYELPGRWNIITRSLLASKATNLQVRDSMQTQGQKLAIQVTKW